MKNISDVVEKYLKDKPYLAEALSEGLINISSLARKIQPEIDRALGIESGIPAISMAIKRLDLTVQNRIASRMKTVIDHLGDIIVRTDLSGFTYANSPKLESKKTEILMSSNISDENFCTICQGVFESNIISSQKMKEKIQNTLANEELISMRDNMVSLTIRLPKENSNLPGLYYFFFRHFAWNNINILEVISTTNEFTVVVDESMLERAFSTIKNIKTSLT
ncbi:MAG: aspartate kinase [Flavobacteriales bacterium]|jgi:hypothetical protein|nr:aspartate kinase [Flavobacteriales bacterium]